MGRAGTCEEKRNEVMTRFTYSQAHSEFNVGDVYGPGIVDVLEENEASKSSVADGRRGQKFREALTSI